MKINMLADIRDFYTKFGFWRPSRPTPLGDLSHQSGVERLRHLKEELTELAEATARGDIVAQADALVDIVWVAMGTAWLMNLPWAQVWGAVAEANMAKVLDGSAKRVGKPEGWVSPEAAIRRAIQTECWLVDVSGSLTGMLRRPE